MDRDLFDQWFNEDIDLWVAASVEDSRTFRNIDFSDNGDFFREIGLGIDALSLFLDDHDHQLTLSSLYALLEEAIGFAVESGWLTQEDHWSAIADLFGNRANEFIGDGRYVNLSNTSISNVRAIKIIEYIVYNFDKQSELYSDDEFTIAEKVQMIRAIIIGLRNNRFIENTPLLSRLFSTLATDWRVLGGGFGTGMGSGTNPWSGG